MGKNKEYLQRNIILNPQHDVENKWVKKNWLPLEYKNDKQWINPKYRIKTIFKNKVTTFIKEQKLQINVKFIWTVKQTIYSFIHSFDSLGKSEAEVMTTITE